MQLVATNLLLLLCASSVCCRAIPALADSPQYILDGAVTAGDTQRQALVKADIIPDVLNDFTPDLSIELSYPSKHKVVDLGNSIKPKHVTSRPVFSIQNLAPTPTRKENATYVLALTDPDATSRSDPVKAQMCHWIATNVTLPSDSSVHFDFSEYLPLPRSSQKQSVSAISELMPYFPPAPPPKTGYHRYVFVVLTSESQKTDLDLQKPKDRPHWGYGKIGAGVREWANENGLIVVGANFFYSKNKKQ